MRALIMTWTAVLAVAVMMIVAALDASGGTPWPLLVVRAAVACGVVILVGRLAGFVLMRTALRRYYEQWRMDQAGSRPRSQR
jgi:hypothetical protein